jgi:hypothetical protein
MTIVINRDQLTAAEFVDISARHWPFDTFPEFWTGFDDYQHDCNRRNRWPNTDAGEAWDRGTEAAARIHWSRWHCMYARDVLDSRKMHGGLQAAIERMRKDGTLPPRSVSKAKPVAANDNATN